jgi:hypothetical protein
MPDRNLDGTPMINGVDLNGRPYGRTAAWENDPWHAEKGYACGPSPLDAPRGTDAGASRGLCIVGLLIIDRQPRHARRRSYGGQMPRCHTRFHRSVSSRRARRWCRDEASRHRRVACGWMALPLDAARLDGIRATPPEEGR